jgi:hypothetical protein
MILLVPIFKVTSRLAHATRVYGHLSMQPIFFE